MQLKVGDPVVHPAYGIGDIAEIEEKIFSQQSTRLYYKVSLPKHTVWVPVEAQETIGLRPITAQSDLDFYRSLLKDSASPLRENHHRRHLELADRLKQGSFQVICEVVRDLTVSSWQKPLGRSDAAVLQKTRERLLDEWAIAASVSKPEATEEIDTLLQATQHTYM